MEDEKTVSYNQINTDFFSQLDFVGITGTLGLIAIGFPASAQAFSIRSSSKSINCFSSSSTFTSIYKFSKCSK